MRERQACKLMLVSQSSQATSAERWGAMMRCAQLMALAQQYPRFGSPRLNALVEREAQRTGAVRRHYKVVERIYRELGLSLRRKKRKRLARARVPLQVAQAASQEWALDFVSEGMACGRQVQVLPVVDVFTGECLALEADTSIGSQRVVRVLNAIIAEREQPKGIRSDNGPEFTSRAYLAWAVGKEVELVHVRPGKPIENAYIESFNGRLARGVLERELVPPTIRRAAADRSLAGTLQPRASTFGAELPNPGRVCARLCRRWFLS